MESSLCCPSSSIPTAREAAKLRRIVLALVDSQSYVNLLSHTMREHVLMHFNPPRRCAVKKHISRTFSALIEEHVLRRVHGWTTVYWPAPVAYPQPFAAWVCRVSTREPKPQEAMARMRPENTEWFQWWKQLGYPWEKEHFAASQRSNEIGRPA